MKIHDVQQGTDLWLWHRLGIPTASEFDRIITPAKGELSKGIDAYIAELIAEQVKPDYTGGYTSRAMWEGTNIEAEARDWCAYTIGPIQQAGFVTDDLERWGCSPDGLWPDSGLELKGPTPKVHVEYMLNPAKFEAEYRCQCQGGMVVCERPGWVLVSFCPPFEPVIVRFVRDEFTAKLEAALVEFSARYSVAVQRFEEMNGGPLVKPPKPRVREVPDPIFMA